MNTPDCLLRPEGVGSLQDFQQARISSLRLYFGPCFDLITDRYAEKSTESHQLSSPHHSLLSQPRITSLATFTDTQTITWHLNSSVETFVYAT